MSSLRDSCNAFIHWALTMDPIVLQAMAKWPHVPAVFDWLALDRRGRWQIHGKPIYHTNMIDFIARNYTVDAHGRWFFQNGPQRVYVNLAYTPWIVRLTIERHLETHTGRRIDYQSAAFIDENGNLLLQFANQQIGQVDDRDLLQLSNALVTSSGSIADEDHLGDFLDGTIELWFVWAKARIAVARINSHQVPSRFSFIPEPQPDLLT